MDCLIDYTTKQREAKFSLLFLIHAKVDRNIKTHYILLLAVLYIKL